LADYEILRSVTPKSYTINLQNCQNAIGRQVSIFWRFANPDSSDSSAIANSVAGGASGVVAQTSCAGALARHNQQIALANNLQSNQRVNCSAALIPAPGVNNTSQITPGQFSGTAYLVFQFL
jgi:type 1 fimbria pilin